MPDFEKPSTIIILVVAALLIVSSVWFVADRISNNREIEYVADSGVIMTIQNVTPNGLSFTFENPTRREYLFGEEYALYVHKNGSWEPVNFVGNVMWISIGYPLAPNSKSMVMTVDWKHLYGELPDGDYKFQKKISIRYSGDNDVYVFEQEFSIPWIEDMTDSVMIMTIQNVTPIGLSFTFENPTEHTHSYDYRYSLYVHRNDSWEPVEPIPEIVGWDDGRALLMPDAKTNVTAIDWQWLYGELPAGDYKFQKRGELINESGDNYIYFLEQEFSIP